MEISGKSTLSSMNYLYKLKGKGFVDVVKSGEYLNALDFSSISDLWQEVLKINKKLIIEVRAGLVDASIMPNTVSTIAAAALDYLQENKYSVTIDFVKSLRFTIFNILQNPKFNLLKFDEHNLQYLDSLLEANGLIENYPELDEMFEFLNTKFACFYQIQDMVPGFVPSLYVDMAYMAYKDLIEFSYNLSADYIAGLKIFIQTVISDDRFDSSCFNEHDLRALDFIWRKNISLGQLIALSITEVNDEILESGWSIDNDVLQDEDDDLLGEVDIDLTVTDVDNQFPQKYEEIMVYSHDVSKYDNTENLNLDEVRVWLTSLGDSSISSEELSRGYKYLIDKLTKLLILFIHSETSLSGDDKKSLFDSMFTHYEALIRKLV